jgi:hypothetical protein
MSLPNNSSANMSASPTSGRGFSLSNAARKAGATFGVPFVKSTNQSEKAGVVRVRRSAQRETLSTSCLSVSRSGKMPSAARSASSSSRIAGSQLAVADGARSAVIAASSRFQLGFSAIAF